MDILWISLICQIGRNHKNMWKNSVFWKIPDKVWTCFGFISWQKSSKNQQAAENSGKTRFSPMLFCPGDLCVSIFTCNHLKSFKVQTLPNLLPYCLPIYLCIFIFIFRYLPAITCSHSKFRPSPTYCPTVLFIYVYIYIFIFIFTCNHLQSF